MNTISKWLRSLLNHEDEDIFHRPIYGAFWDTLQPSSGESLLAINCRHTELLRSAYNKGIEACGIHRSKKEMNQTKDEAPHATLRLWKGTEIPFHDNSFNYVFEFDSFECFSDLEVGLSEVKRVLKKEGIFIAVVPNKDFLLSSKYPLSDETAIKKGIIDRSLDEWEKLFVQMGFRIADIKKDQWFVQYQHKNSQKETGAGLKIGVKDFLIFALPLKYVSRFVFFLKL